MELEQFVLSEEQRQLQSAVRRLCEERSPEAEVRRVMDTDDGYDRDLWAQMAGQLGLHGLAVPEQYGGAGSGWQEMALVLEELGRALVPSPYLFSAGMATAALLASGDDGACADLLPAIAAGERVATVAITEDTGSWDLADVGLTARERDGGWVLDGHKALVPYGHVADLLLVAARTDDGVAVFAVEDTASVQRERQRPLDPTRPLARLTFDATAARLVGSVSTGASTLARTLQVGAVLLGAEQVGGAQRVLDMATGYANTRHQFGRPIGGLQAVKHKCADMLLRTESARSLAYYGAWAAGRDRDDFATVAHTVKAYCSDAYLFAAATNIQVHGGIGFTWEHPAHLYYKRAKSSEIMFGSPSVHLDALADCLGV